ncbi:MAG: tRNA-uridine aminocarboxypropyltransferase [Massilia sp.]
MTAPMTVPPATRRPLCAACLRPQRTCICHWVAPVDSAVALLILQHPLEVAQAKGSARLLHLCVAGSSLLAGESFNPSTLEAMLHADGRRPVLLYPALAGADALGLAPPPVLAPSALDHPERLRLVVLDASWRKSRKMLYLNPILQQLPRLALRDMPASHYRIRKAHAPDQLSSLEAATYALMRLEPGNPQLASLLDAFDGFVGQQEQLARGA